jgi:hypothetical protein
MRHGDKGKADIILKKLLADSGYILGREGNSNTFIETILAHLMQEEPKVTQLFQIRSSATSRPILDSFTPEERSIIMNSGIPQVRNEHQEMTLLRLVRDASIQEGIRNWFHTMDERYYIVNNKHYVFYSKDRKIETLPPYFLIETHPIHLSDIPETLDLGPYTQDNQTANYGLIAVLLHTETPRGRHAIAFIKDGTNWVKFDNENKQQIHSLQNIEGKGITFLYRRQ